MRSLRKQGISHRQPHAGLDFVVDDGPSHGGRGAATRKPERVAADLTLPECILLFCIDTGLDWRKASRVTGATVAAMVLKGLVERDAAGRLSLSGEGRGAVEVLLKVEE